MSKQDESTMVTASLARTGTPADRKPVEVRAKLVAVAGADEGIEQPLDARVEVGTDAGCDLVLTDPAVSHRHAAFERVAGGFLVKDLGSRNGTFVGECPSAGARPVVARAGGADCRA